MSTKLKVLIGLALFFGITIRCWSIFGSSARTTLPAAGPVRLDSWIDLSIGGIDISITKAVLYLVLASGLTIATMTFIARRMQRGRTRSRWPSSSPTT